MQRNIVALMVLASLAIGVFAFNAAPTPGGGVHRWSSG